MPSLKRASSACGTTQQTLSRRQRPFWCAACRALPAEAVGAGRVVQIQREMMRWRGHTLVAGVPDDLGAGHVQTLLHDWYHAVPSAADAQQTIPNLPAAEVDRCCRRHDPR